MPDSDLIMVSEFLTRFYHQEPDYLEATLKALNILKGLDKYKWELANSFTSIFENEHPPDTLKNIVLFRANRYVQSDEDAKEVLKRIFKDNVLDMALFFDEEEQDYKNSK